MIFDAETFVRNLPHTIEAVFFMKHSSAQEACEFEAQGRGRSQHFPPSNAVTVDFRPLTSCGATGCDMALSGAKCEDYARSAWRNMRRHFGLTVEQLPLVRFDPFDHERPFHAIAPPVFPEG